MTSLTAYGSLFLISLLAATIFPAQSELVLAALLATGDHSPLALFAVATSGNVLGSVVNWVIGRGIARFRDRRWFPVSASALTRAERWYGKFGLWSLLFAWLPVVGDPLTVVAGTLKVPFWIFLALVTIGKAARYALLVAAV